MRLWHKDLVSVLPRQQLLSQWRECCCIAKNIKQKGTPNHLLVNKVLDYNKAHFYNYCCLIVNEMLNRGYNVNEKSRKIIFDYVDVEDRQVGSSITHKQLYEQWHNERYFWQCYFNLQEKYDCGGITEKEWLKVKSVGLKLLNNCPDLEF